MGDCILNSSIHSSSRPQQFALDHLPVHYIGAGVADLSILRSAYVEMVIGGVVDKFRSGIQVCGGPCMYLFASQLRRVRGSQDGSAHELTSMNWGSSQEQVYGRVTLEQPCRSLVRAVTYAAAMFKSMSIYVVAE